LVSATLLEHELMLLESYKEAPDEHDTLHMVASSRF
jgi:hypothetical protein